MSKKIAIASLIAALAAFGYLFWLNPGQIDIVLFPEYTSEVVSEAVGDVPAKVIEEVIPAFAVKTSTALALFLFFLMGFSLALAMSALREAWSSFLFWKQRKRDEKRAFAEKLVEQSRGRIVHGDVRTARRLLKRAQKISPERNTISMELARAEIADGKYDQAEKRMRTLLESQPRNPEVISLHLELSKAKGDFEGQIAALNRWLELDSEHYPSLCILRDLYASKGSFGEAVRMQEKVMRSSGVKNIPEQKELLLTLKMKYAATLTGAEAQRVLQEISSDDDYAPAYARLGRVHASSGDFDKAEKAWLKGFKATGKVALLLYVENSMRSRGKIDGMLSTYKKYARKSPAAALLRTRLLISLGRFSEAATYLASLDRDVSMSPYGRWLAGEAFLGTGDYEKAARALRESSGGSSDAPLAPFTCSKCGALAGKWMAECVSCNEADVLEFDDNSLMFR